MERTWRTATETWRRVFEGPVLCLFFFFLPLPSFLLSFLITVGASAEPVGRARRAAEACPSATGPRSDRSVRGISAVVEVSRAPGLPAALMRRPRTFSGLAFTRLLEAFMMLLGLISGRADSGYYLPRAATGVPLADGLRGVSEMGAWLLGLLPLSLSSPLPPSLSLPLSLLPSHSSLDLAQLSLLLRRNCSWLALDEFFILLKTHVMIIRKLRA